MNIREVLTDIINTQGKLDIFHITITVNHETNQITPMWNVLFDAKGSTVNLPFILALNGDDLSMTRVYVNCFDSSKGTPVSEIVYSSEKDFCCELSSIDEFPDYMKNRYTTEYLSELFENYKYIVEISKKLEAHRGTI